MTQIAMIALQLQNEVVTRTIKKRNPIAKALKFFTPKVIKDKTKYTRKEKHGQTNRYYEHSDSPKTST